MGRTAIPATSFPSWVGKQLRHKRRAPPYIYLTMTKHSKNNTASSIFTYAEYKKLDYGTKRQRLGNESMRRFDACALCLNRAREPLACQEGHLFCKECVYTDLC